MPHELLVSCLFLTWNCLPLLNQPLCGQSGQVVYLLSFQGFLLRNEGAGQTQWMAALAAGETAGESHLGRFNLNREAGAVANIFQGFGFKNVSSYGFWLQSICL